MTQLLALILALMLPLLGADLGASWLGPGGSASRALPLRCRSPGGVCASRRRGCTDIPNSSSGTVPGAFIVLQWRGVSLQLPRTNNAGTPSYSDGRWWWQALDPDHPEFAQRRGDWETYSCDRAPQT